MRIWIDILTPKQILFFTPLIQELKRRGHEVLCTSRHYREVNLLAAKRGMELRFVGRHGGAPLPEKLKASCERILEFSDLVGRFQPDYAVSFSSPECSRTAFGLGIRHICISDSPHAEKVCRLTIPLSDLLVTPWIIPSSSWSRYGIAEDRLIRYRALDPVVWLRRRPAEAARKEDFGLDSSRKTITLRLDETQAAYLLSSDRSISKRLLDALLQSFRDCELFVLGRYQSQVDSFKEAYGSKAKIAANVVDGAGLISVSDVFVGMGGTMTTEAALLGTPTVSLFQGDLLYTEGYLIKEGLLVRPESIEHAVETVRNLLQDGEQRSALRKRAKDVMADMEDPIEVILKTIEEDARATGLLK